MSNLNSKTTEINTSSGKLEFQPLFGSIFVRNSGNHHSVWHYHSEEYCREKVSLRPQSVSYMAYLPINSMFICPCGYYTSRKETLKLKLLLKLHLYDE